MTNKTALGEAGCFAVGLVIPVGLAAVLRSNQLLAAAPGRLARASFCL